MGLLLSILAGAAWQAQHDSSALASHFKRIIEQPCNTNKFWSQMFSLLLAGSCTECIRIFLMVIVFGSLLLTHFAIADVLHMYEKEFRNISKAHYAESPWPASGDVQELLDADRSFIVLYNLLYFKHLLAVLPSKEAPARSSDYGDAWDSYRDFFDYVIG